MSKPALELQPEMEEWEYEDELMYFETLFDKVFPKGVVAMVAKNHGWRKLDGYRPAQEYSDGRYALFKAMVNDASVRVYVRKNSEYGYHIALNTAHHDSPTWDEWTYLVRPKYLKTA